MVVGAVFADDAGADAAIRLLRESGVRPQDISVVAADEARAERIASERAWTPDRGRRGRLARALDRFAAVVDRAPARVQRFLPEFGLPRSVRDRYRSDIDAGRIVVLAAAGGQPPDTLAALFAQARGERIEQWWQEPASLFAPPELAGPF